MPPASSGWQDARTARQVTNPRERIANRDGFVMIDFVDEFFGSNVALRDLKPGSRAFLPVLPITVTQHQATASGETRKGFRPVRKTDKWQGGGEAISAILN